MSDEYQWQQLGSVVNKVLVQAKAQAMRNGSVSKAASLGFLADEPAPVRKPAQLELPFGIQAKTHASKFGEAAAPRGVRLM